MASVGAVFMNVVSVLASATASSPVNATAVVPSKCASSDASLVPLLARLASVFLTTLYCALRGAQLPAQLGHLRAR